jgi:hypothetical protein
VFIRVLMKCRCTGFIARSVCSEDVWTLHSGVAESKGRHKETIEVSLCV